MSPGGPPPAPPVVREAPAPESAPAVARDARLHVSVLRGDEAARLLGDPGFGAEWDAIAGLCPWTTVFQRRPFVTAWFETYGDVWTPVVVTGQSEFGALGALFVLAASSDGRTLEVAGTFHAEYQGWISTPEAGETFPPAALDALAREFPSARLVLRYVVPGAPLGWVAREDRWASRTFVEDVPRALRDISGAEAAASAKKSSNKNRMRQLRKRGEVSFAKVRTASEFSALLDEFIPLHDFRQGAAHGAYPFESDPRKRAFHEKLFTIPGFLHVTALRCGGKLVAAQIGVADRGTVVLGPHTYSPFFAAQSPGKMLMLHFAEVAAADGISVLDLTPGPGWKDRFATRSDVCRVVHIDFDRVRHAALVASRRRDEVAKRWAIRFGTTPDAVRATLAKVRRYGAAGIAAAALRRVARTPKWVRSREIVDLYRYDPAAAAAVESPGLFRVNSVEDLLLFRPFDRNLTREAFVSAALARLGEGHTVLTCVQDGRLAAAGWIAPDQRESVVTEVRERIPLPAGSATLYDFWTAPAFRGRGLHLAALRQALSIAGRIPGVTGVWMGVSRTSGPALRNTRRVGFPWFASLGMDVVLGKVAPRTGKKALHEQPTWTEALRQSAKRAMLHAARFCGGFAAARALTDGELRVIGWHGWESDGESAFAPRLFMRKDTFERRLDWLVRNRFRVVSLDEGLEGLRTGKLPRRAVVLTIDDGAASTATVAADALARRGMHATLFVTTYHVANAGPVFRTSFRYMLWRSPKDALDLTGIAPFGEGTVTLGEQGATEVAYQAIVRHAETVLSEADRQALLRTLAERLGVSWDEMLASRRCSLVTPAELRAMAESGAIDLQLHTHRHRFPATEADTRREIEENRAALSAVLPVRFDHLCYPSNERHPSQFPWMRELGIRSGVTCDPGLNPPGSDPFEIRRLLDGECVREIEFAAELSGFNEVARRVLARVRRLLRR
ncbi:MAG: hypothetical protein HMLKMBBP_03393 [Planctomycetes bacterium]|nr:hypothetical protein [Planctomycetota bacterium]